MRKKQLGFTLVEILAVIVILGILSGVAIGGYSAYIKKAKKNYYIAQEKLLTQSGRDFYNDNKGKMPQASGEESCVTLNTLINFKYIDKVFDYNKKVCNGDKSKACVKKLSNTNNLYYSYLNCGNEFTSVEYKNPELQFSLTEGNIASRDNEEYKLIMTVNDTATKNASQENYGVASYRYVIYKKYSGENNNDLVYYDTGWKSVKGKNQEKVVVNINLDSDGTYYVRGWAYNWGGKEANGKSGEVTLRFKLDCKNQIEFSADNYVQNTWTNSNIDTLITKKGGVNKFDVSLENTDVDTNSVTNTNLVIGHKKRDKNINITSNGKNKLKVICYDSNNNTDTTESIYYQIDKVRPTCSVSRDAGIGYDSLHYTNKDLNLTAVCSDKGGSGCKQANTSVTLTASQDRSLPSYQVANIYDKAGNSTTCTTGVYQDVTPPKISVTLYDANGNTIVSKSNNIDITDTAYSYVKIKISINDSASGISTFRIGNGTSQSQNNTLVSGTTPSSSYEYVRNVTGTHIFYITASDKASNSGGIRVMFKIDTDRPAISVACVKKTSCTAVTSRPSTNNGNYTPGSWSNKCVYCEASSSSGVTLKERACGAAANSTSTSTCLSWSTKKYHDVNSNGISNLQFEATKSTGTTNMTNVSVKVDTGAPNLGVKMTGRSSTSDAVSESNTTYTSNSWSNKYITIFLSNSDSVSGIKSGYPQLWIDSGSATNSSNGNQGKWLSRTKFDVNAEGVSTLKFRTMDNAGNIKTTSSYTIKLDHSKPSFTSLTTSNNKISFAAKDTISGIKSYCVKIKGGDCTNDSGYVAVNSGSTYSLSNISKITTSKKTTIQAGTTYTVVVKDYAGNSISKDISTSLTFVKTKYWSTRFCTMHNGIADATGGSTTKSCSQAVDSGTNCYTAGYNVNNHGDKTYANMKISSLTTSVSGSDLKVKITFEVANGYFGTYSSGYNRYMCLKKGNRTFTNATCTSDTQSVKTDWGGNGKSVDITRTFTIKNYNSKAGSYSFKMWGDTYKTSCSSDVNALNQIYSFQTDYIFKLK